MKEEKKRESLLDLTTMFRREHIKIDGIAYELRGTQEFGAVDFGMLSEVGRKISEESKLMVNADKSLNAESANRVNKLLDIVLASAVVDLPDKVRDALTIEMKEQIVAVFIEVALPKPETVAATKKK